MVKITTILGILVFFILLYVFYLKKELKLYQYYLLIFIFICILGNILLMFGI